MKKEEKNLRKNSRKNVQIPLDIKPVHIFTETQILNISKGGIFISTPRPLPDGTEIEIEFFLPRASKKIRVKGTVKWSINKFEKPDGTQGIVPGMGVKFIQISKEALKQINLYLKK